MLTYRVWSAPSPIEGTGVFAAVKIPGRAKIGEVTGELISIRKRREGAPGEAAGSASST